MTNIDTALTLRLEASLSKFEKQMSRAMSVGEKTATGLQQRFDGANRKMSRSAEASAAVIGREMDRLRSKYDPLFAASKRYEKELNELNRAHKLGALSTKQYDAALETLNAQYAQMSTRASGLRRGLGALTTQARGTGGGIQNVAFQIGDFATQVGAGTSASIALGQQLPQLLGGFGALGAVLGAVVAIGVPLGAALLRMGSGSENLEDQMEGLEEAVSDYRSAVEAANVPTEELAEKYGTATRAAREFLLTLRDIERVDALNGLQSALDTLSSTFGSLNAGNSDDPLGIGSALEKTLQRVRRDLDVTGQDAIRITNELRALSDAATPREAVDAANQLRAVLIDILGPMDQMDSGAREFVEKVSKAGDKAAELVGASDAATQSIANASSEAAGLAANLGGAVAQMRALAAARVADARQASELARIRSETVGDPVARAGRTAVAEFQNDLLGSGKLIGPDNALQIAAAENEVRKAAEDAARLTEEADKADAAYRKLQQSIAKGEKEKKDKFDPFSLGEKQLLSAERNLEMLGKTASEVAALQAKYQMLDEAKRRNIDLDIRSAETGMTVAETIEMNAQKVGNLVDQYQRASERAQFFDDIQNQLKDGILDAIIEGENFVGVLENIAKAFARAALEAALFGSGPLAPASGSGIFSVFGGLLKSFDGGGMTSSGPRAGGVDGKGGYPAIVHPNEVIVDLTKPIRAAANSNARSRSSTFAPVYNIDARGADQAAVARLERRLVDMDRNRARDWDAQMRRNEVRKVRG